MNILTIEVSYDTHEHLYLVKVGANISTFTDYLDAKEFVENKTRKSLWKFEDKLKEATVRVN